ncbi:general odorant-binding protein 19d-like [Musca autumnalis]|uniref:general odorant-binding protein 19d-like n=1 Tax=Musca autumnalis TaxID=221902 RepID=UPI003CF9C72F
MKFFGVIVLLVAAVGYIRAEELSKENLVVVAGVCKEEKGASDDDVAALKAHEAPTTHEGKCMVACIMEKFEMLADGKLVKEKAIEVGVALFDDDEAKATAVVESCESLEVDDDPCEAAVQYGGCLKEHADAH